MGALALSILLVFVISFLLGSIPWGIVISKYLYKTDIRKHGSGNIGTTNALRTLGKAGGGLVFLLDFGKGVFSGVIALLAYLWFVAAEPGSIGAFELKAFMVLSSGNIVGNPDITHEVQSLLATATCGCMLGHIFSPWLKFKGGKGVAVAVGCVFVSLGWLPAVSELALFALLVILTRYVSVGSLIAVAVLPLVSLFIYWGNAYAAIMITVAALAVIWAHRGNIKRLRAGTELKLGDKRAKKRQGQLGA